MAKLHAIYELLQDSDCEDFINIWNESLSVCGDGDRCIYEMEDIDSDLDGLDATTIIEAVLYKGFNLNHAFYGWAEGIHCEYLQSFDDPCQYEGIDWDVLLKYIEEYDDEVVEKYITSNSLFKYFYQAYFPEVEEQRVKDILNELIATGEYDLVGGNWDSFADSVQEKL